MGDDTISLDEAQLKKVLTCVVGLETGINFNGLHELGRIAGLWAGDVNLRNRDSHTLTVLSSGE